MKWKHADKPASVSLKFTRVAGYPVDLYYIMDLSTSMQDDKENLEKLTNSLAQTMKNITSDFRMGFGSFIDKPIAPFVNEAQMLDWSILNYHMHHIYLIWLI